MKTNYIVNAENRIKSYKEMIQDAFKLTKENSVPNEWMDLFLWWKDELRDAKNTEERLLKKLSKENEYEKQGLNPPFCYKTK